MKKWLKLSTWVRLVSRTFTYLRAPDIPLREKALLLVPAALYWVLPDVLPYVPVDDLAVTLLLSNWFLHRIESKFPHKSKE
ncbi:hypothetical protein [Paenibacillus sp.]|uniref:hypothetical protein n=1 Tax=Paenibacillus sp. TaxID=58172 RepID=UPI002D7244C6|nr:hypothetical protein [Paenibacillus sp.]HZG57749.1 hypothetical protein [Paenibacillus sp.]